MGIYIVGFFFTFIYVLQKGYLHTCNPLVLSKYFLRFRNDLPYAVGLYIIISNVGFLTRAALIFLASVPAVLKVFCARE